LVKIIKSGTIPKASINPCDTSNGTDDSLVRVLRELIRQGVFPKQVYPQNPFGCLVQTNSLIIPWKSEPNRQCYVKHLASLQKVHQTFLTVEKRKYSFLDKLILLAVS
jgi:hypothetical protein